MRKATLNTYTVPYTNIKCPHCQEDFKVTRPAKKIDRGHDLNFCPHCDQPVKFNYRETSNEGLIIAKPLRKR